MSVQVVYKDRDILCIIKPPCISSESDILADGIKKQEKLKDLFLINRLDLNVGGLLLFALNRDTASKLGKMMCDHKFVKEYCAVLDSSPDEESGTFIDLLFRDKAANKTYVVNKERKGVRRAELKYRCIGKIDTDSGKYILVSITTLTGRTHQIRVQFASRGYPLLGDKKYGSRIVCTGPALYAYRMVFDHPRTHEQLVLSADLPRDLFPWNLF